MERSGDPIRDAERWQEELEDMESGRDFILCDNCGGKIFREDDKFDGDDYWEFDDAIVCKECLDEYLKVHRHCLC